jgi:hypothetical protein
MALKEMFPCAWLVVLSPSRYLVTLNCDCRHDLLTSLFNLPDQTLENNEMKGKKNVPVGFSEQTSGLIVSIYGQPVFVSFSINLELKPCFSGQLHFGP